MPPRNDRARAFPPLVAAKAKPRAALAGSRPALAALSDSAAACPRSAECLNH